MALDPDLRTLLDAPNYVHLSTLRSDGSPRNWVVWVGLDGDHILVCTGRDALKAKDMTRNTRVALSLTDLTNPYRMGAAQGRVVEVRDDSAGTIMDAISHKYTGQPFPMRGPGRVCFAIEIDRGAVRQLGFTHAPGD
jgi:PPOX class probable F420-dependent enzyme